MESISPKQAAQAIGVSESSLKRWCDAGLIDTTRTAGGHRRLSLPSLITFLRGKGHAIAHPELLGITGARPSKASILSELLEPFGNALAAGDEERTRRILLDLFLAGHPISALADQLIAPAFHAVGDQWQCGQLEVYQERRACEVSLRGLHDLRRLLPDPPEDAPLAIGAAPDQDGAGLGTMLAEMVLTQAGWRAVSLGSWLPLNTLQSAVEEHRPKLFWLSVAHLQDEAAFANDYREFFTAVESKTAVVVGGRALTESVRQQMRYCAYCGTMRELEQFALTVKGLAVGKSSHS